MTASSLATARPLGLASRQQQMTPPPRASVADDSALLILLLLLSQPPLLLLLLSREATAVGEQQPSRAEQILKPSLLIGGSIRPPQKTSRAEPTFKSRLLMGEFSPLQASRGSPVS